MRLLALALVAAFVLAGCSGAKDDSGSSTTTRTSTTTTRTTSSSTTTTETTTTSGTPPPPPPDNHAPSAELSADNRTGAFPLNLTFTVDGSDPDQDALTWHLSFGDGTTALSGSGVPQAVPHNYTDIGNYTAVLTVSDVYGVENTTSLLIIVTKVYFATLTLSDTATGACTICTPAGQEGGVVACAGYNAGLSGHDCVWFDLPANATFQPYHVTSLGTAKNADPGVLFTDSCDSDANLLAAYDDNPPGQAEDGLVPDGARCIILYENNDVQNVLTAIVG